jgi:dipicolinic acid synthetase A subunit
MGFGVRTFGCGTDLPEGITRCKCPREAASGAVGILLPLPATRDGETVYCPLDPDSAVTFAEIESLLDTTTVKYLFGGNLPPDFVGRVKTTHASHTVDPVTVVDYMSREDVQIHNAHITAEGAVVMAAGLLSVTLRGAHAAILGYGRIGQQLARLLISLGATVTVLARRTEVLALAETHGCKTARLGADNKILCRGFDVILNTVPVRLFDEAFLSRIVPETLVLDLAPTPGVADPADARAVREHTGLQLVAAPAIPGKYAPVSAGRVLASCVLSVWREKEVRS